MSGIPSEELTSTHTARSTAMSATDSARLARYADPSPAACDPPDGFSVASIRRADAYFHMCVSLLRVHEVSQSLLSDPSHTHVVMHGYTPLHRIFLEDTRAILAVAGNSVAGRASREDSAAILACEMHAGVEQQQIVGVSVHMRRQAACVYLLANRGADVHAKCPAGLTPLQYAIAANSPIACMILLRYGADVGSRSARQCDCEGACGHPQPRTVFHVATDTGFSPLLQEAVARLPPEPALESPRSRGTLPTGGANSPHGRRRARARGDDASEGDDMKKRILDALAGLSDGVPPPSPPSADVYAVPVRPGPSGEVIVNNKWLVALSDLFRGQDKPETQPTAVEKAHAAGLDAEGLVEPVDEGVFPGEYHVPAPPTAAMHELLSTRISELGRAKAVPMHGGAANMSNIAVGPQSPERLHTFHNGDDPHPQSHGAPRALSTSPVLHRLSPAALRMTVEEPAQPKASSAPDRTPIAFHEPLPPASERTGPVAMPASITSAPANVQDPRVGYASQSASEPASAQPQGSPFRTMLASNKANSMHRQAFEATNSSSNYTRRGGRAAGPRQFSSLSRAHALRNEMRGDGIMK